MMKEKIKNIIAEILELNDERKEEIKASSKLRDDLSFDSLQLAQLTVEIEDEFDVDVFENGVIETVQEIYDQIEENNE